MPSPLPRSPLSTVKAEAITTHVASDSSLCIDLSTPFRQDSLLISKRRQTRDSSPPRLNQPKIQQEDPPSIKKMPPPITTKTSAIAKNSVSFAPTLRVKIIKPIDPGIVDHLWYTEEEQRIMQRELGEEVRKARNIFKQLRRTDSRKDVSKLQEEMKKITMRGIEQLKSKSTHKQLTQETRAVIDGVLDAQDEYWRRNEASLSSIDDQASRKTEELLLAHASSALSEIARERAFQFAEQDEAAALEIYTS